MQVDTGVVRHHEVIVLGAGAAGLMCAIAAGRRGRQVLVLDHANKVGKKILMSGGGRCNFTNIHCTPDNFISANPHFAKSALARFTPWDFIEMVDRHDIPWHEKKAGQLFCDRSSKDIVAMLLDECRAVGAEVRTHSPARLLEPGPPHLLSGPDGMLGCDSLVIATGGYSIPAMGATGFGLDLARRLDLPVRPTRAGLVPFTLDPESLARLDGLSGVSLDAAVTAGDGTFRENILFTHRGLSGPGILQASSYWQPGDPVEIDLFPGSDLDARLQEAALKRPRQELKNFLAEHLTRRVAERWCQTWLESRPLGQLRVTDREAVRAACQPWTLRPAGTEGYRTAEVTLGGVDTSVLSSKTMECRNHPGLYFIGEVVDVTGHLGGHNFQWAWASAHAAGQHV